MADALISIVELAKGGDKEALEELVIQVQDRIFKLSLRMLFHPQDAEDATQEILIKMITRLDSYRRDGAFESWVLKIASNHLLSFRRKKGVVPLSFDKMAAFIVPDWPKPWRELEAAPLQELIVEEFRIACLQMVLLGLDRRHRLAYILGVIINVSGKQGAEILEVKPATFRKRLQRSKERIQNFLLTNCALIKPGNPCLCERQADYALAIGHTDKNAFPFVNHPCYVRHSLAAINNLSELDELQRISTLMKNNPKIMAPHVFVDNLRGLIESDRFQLLGQGKIETASKGFKAQIQKE